MEYTINIIFMKNNNINKKIYLFAYLVFISLLFIEISIDVVGVEIDSNILFKI